MRRYFKIAMCCFPLIIVCSFLPHSYRVYFKPFDIYSGRINHIDEIPLLNHSLFSCEKITFFHGEFEYGLVARFDRPKSCQNLYLCGIVNQILFDGNGVILLGDAVFDKMEKFVWNADSLSVLPEDMKRILFDRETKMFWGRIGVNTCFLYVPNCAIDNVRFDRNKLLILITPNPTGCGSVTPTTGSGA